MNFAQIAPLFIKVAQFTTKSEKRQIWAKYRGNSGNCQKIICGNFELCQLPGKFIFITPIIQNMGKIEKISNTIK